MEIPAGYRTLAIMNVRLWNDSTGYYLPVNKYIINDKGDMLNFARNSCNQGYWVNMANINDNKNLIIEFLWQPLRQEGVKEIDF